MWVNIWRISSVLTLFTPIMSGVRGSWPGLSAELRCCAVLDAAAKLQGPSHPGSRAHSVQQPGLWVGDTTVQAGWREDCSYYRCILSSAVYYDPPCVDWWCPPGQVAHISR